MYPGDQKSSILEGSSSINSPHLILTPSSHLSLFQHPWPSPSPFTWPWVMWSFWFGLLFIRGLPSIKAIPFLSYTSVLISTKITTALSLWDPSKHQLKGLKKLKDWDYLWVQHISWSLVLLSGQNHGTFTSPSEVPATSQFCISFQCGSVLNSEVENNEINAQCIPCDIWQKMQVLSGGIQSTLDNVLEVSKGPKEFSSEALLHSLTQLVTCDDCCDNR